MGLNKRKKTMTGIRGICPRCTGKGYVPKYGVYTRIMGITIFSAPGPVIGLKICPLCEGLKDVEIKDK